MKLVIAGNHAEYEDYLNTIGNGDRSSTGRIHTHYVSDIHRLYGCNKTFNHTIVLYGTYYARKDIVDLMAYVDKLGLKVELEAC